MSDIQKQIVKQTPEMREELRVTAKRCQDASDRLQEHGIGYGVTYQRNQTQDDGSIGDGLAISRSVSAECALMEMMADWYDARSKAIEEGTMGRFMGEVLALQEESGAKAD